MYYREHGVPHFYAEYSGAEASVAIEALDVLEGSLPGRARRLVEEWATLHRHEPEANWERACQRQPLIASTRFPSMGDMSALVHVITVEVIGPQRLHLAFDDGSEGEVQFTDDDWGGVFDALREPAYFAQVVVDEELGTIVWPNGADVAPETLHAWATRGRNRQPA